MTGLHIPDASSEDAQVARIAIAARRRGWGLHILPDGVTWLYGPEDEWCVMGELDGDLYARALVLAADSEGE